MNLKTKITNNSPQIFLAIGIASFIGAAVTAVVKADKAKPIFKEAKENFKAASIEDNRYGFKNETEVKLYKAKVVASAAIDISKEMALSIALTVFGTSCVCKSYKIMNNRQLALISGIDILDASRKTLREAVKENVDEETMQKIDDTVRAKSVSKQIDAIKRVDDHICDDVETCTRFFSAETSNKYPGGADTVFPFSKLKKHILTSCCIYVVWYILTRSSMLLDYLKTMTQSVSAGTRMAARALSILVFLGLILSIMIMFLIAITV